MYIRPGTSTQQEPGAHTWLFLDWSACLYLYNEVQARTHPPQCHFYPGPAAALTKCRTRSNVRGELLIWQRVRRCRWPLQAGPRGSWLCSGRNKGQFLLTSQQIRTQREGILLFGSVFLFLLLFSLRSQPTRWCCPYSRWVFCSQLILSRNALSSPAKVDLTNVLIIS